MFECIHRYGLMQFSLFSLYQKKFKFYLIVDLLKVYLIKFQKFLDIKKLLNLKSITLKNISQNMSRFNRNLSMSNF